jgi:diguanylate cyclase
MPLHILNKVFACLHASENRARLECLRAIVDSHAEEIVEVFYRRLLEEPSAAPFLSSDLVQSRLVATMKGWLRGLFQPLASEEEIEAYIQRQRVVGNVHARIDLPMMLVGYGVFVLKREIARHVCEGIVEPCELGASLALADLIIDASVISINRAYFLDVAVNAQSISSLQIHAATQFLALECERLRSSLSDWLSAVLMALQRRQFTPGAFPRVRSSDFSLWLAHKADLVFPGRPELAALRRQAEQMDEIAEALCRRALESGEPPPDLVDQLQSHVRQANWQLGRMSQEALDADSSKDALTRLLSRRYLSAILQHEVRHSFSSGMRFSLLLVDIDHFKQLNDAHGHSAGDLALKFVASQMMEATRAGDQIFRYGGEEFLVVLVESGMETALQVAEKIRKRIGDADLGEFDLSHKIPGLRLTVSIGVSVYDGHPDYQLTVDRADAALYQAKQRGRNCCVIDEQSRQFGETL